MLCVVRLENAAVLLLTSRCRHAAYQLQLQKRAPGAGDVMVLC